MQETAKFAVVLGVIAVAELACIYAMADELRRARALLNMPAAADSDAALLPAASAEGLAPTGAFWSSNPVTLRVDGNSFTGHKALLTNATSSRITIELRNANGKFIDPDSGTPANVGKGAGVLFNLRFQRSPYDYLIFDSNGSLVYVDSFDL